MPDAEIGEAFGEQDPRKMPRWFFSGAHRLEYSTAVRGNPDIQNRSIAPRWWYVDAYFTCAKCKKEFVWSAGEQKAWFEKYRFWIDVSPRRCRSCRGRIRHALQLRKEYDALVGSARAGANLEQKRRIVQILDELENYCGCLPDRMQETRNIFHKRLSNS